MGRTGINACGDHVRPSLLFAVLKAGSLKQEKELRHELQDASGLAPRSVTDAAIDDRPLSTGTLKERLLEQPGVIAHHSIASTSDGAETVTFVAVFSKSFKAIGVHGDYEDSAITEMDFHGFLLRDWHAIAGDLDALIAPFRPGAKALIGIAPDDPDGDKKLACTAELGIIALNPGWRQFLPAHVLQAVNQHIVPAKIQALATAFTEAPDYSAE